MNRKVEVVIAGVQKAATTSLKNYLGQHPSIITHRLPEFGYFSIDNQFQKGFDFCFNREFDEKDITKKILIKNVDIIFWEECIARVKNHNPSAKIIVLFRNPVDRAYSAYWFARRRGWETATTFKEAIHLSPMRYKDRLGISNVSYIEKGNYAAQINTLHKYFKPHQTIFFLQEDLRSRSSEVMSKLFAFLEIDVSFEPETSIEHNHSARPRIASLARITAGDNTIKSSLKKIFPAGYLRRLRLAFHEFNREKFIPPAMTYETKQKLIEHYKPLNQQLEKILNRDLSHWNL